MKPKAVQTNGKVTLDGELKIYHRSRLLEDLKVMNNCDVEIIIKRKLKVRSSNQLRYYFGVLVPVVCEGFRDLGYIWTKDKTDKFLRDTFFFNEIVNEKTGTIMKEPLSLKSEDGEITTARMMEIVDEIIIWASIELSITIPLPNEQAEMFDEKYYEQDK